MVKKNAKHFDPCNKVKIYPFLFCVAQLIINTFKYFFINISNMPVTLFPSHKSLSKVIF